MFFQEKIKSIRRDDQVLEIGPGATPYFRSNAFLELNFASGEEKLSQRGGVRKDASFGQRMVYFYDGDEFPFKNNQFDYVICSHVIEHVVNPEKFMAEIFRTGGGRGYIEYPLVTYEYLYDFSVHLQFIKFDCDNKVLKYLPKEKSSLQSFTEVTTLLNGSLAAGWDELVASNRQMFFEGFEFLQPFPVSPAKGIAELVPCAAEIRRRPGIHRMLNKLINRVFL